jgi:hypothetical protein
LSACCAVPTLLFITHRDKQNISLSPTPHTAVQASSLLTNSTTAA